MNERICEDSALVLLCEEESPQAILSEVQRTFPRKITYRWIIRDIHKGSLLFWISVRRLEAPVVATLRKHRSLVADRSGTLRATYVVVSKFS